MSAPLPFALDVEARVGARPETVFRYFTDAALYGRWMGSGAELDPRPGGLYRVRIPGRPVVEGRYVLVEPPHRLVFTWGWVGSDEVPPGSTTVEVTLRPEGEGTVVRLEHRGFTSEPARAQHLEGWGHYLARLTVAARGEDPGPDPAELADAG